MLPTFKAGLLVSTMAAVAVVPAAGLVTLASVDAANAKGGEGNGNGNGGNGNSGRGSEARGGPKEAHGGGRPEGAGSRGNGGPGGGRSESARRGGDPVSNFIRSLGGEGKRDARAQPRAETRAETRAARLAPTENAPLSSISPGKRPARNSEMRPGDLGNMNGALNANINAVLAHIRNGNVEGPIGGLAALAIADAAYARIDGGRVLKEEEVAELLEANGYDSVREYYDALAGEDPAEEIPMLDAAIAALGEDVNEEESWTSWRPDGDAIWEAEEALEARMAAESGLLTAWNKNADTNPDVATVEEQALLDDLRDRLDGHETDIDQAMAEAEAEARETPELPEEGADASCGGIDACEEQEDEVAAAD